MVRVDIGSGALDIWIQSGEKRLEEYNLRAPDGIRQECYVASEDGKCFGICVETLRDTDADKIVSVFLDGVPVPLGFSPGKIAGECVKQGHIRVSDTEIKRFTFGRLELKEDDGDSDAAARSMGGLGTIRVQVGRIEITGCKSNPFRDISLPGENAVSERAKKAGGHSIKFGEVTVAEATTHNMIGICTILRGSPMHEVVFRYAPLDVLYAREIIMRPLSQAVNVRMEEASSESLAASTSTARGPQPAPGSVKTEEGSLPGSSSQAGGSRKRALESTSSSDSSSSSSDESDVLAGLDKKDIRRLARIGAKLAAGLSKSKKKKKTKVEPQDQPAFISGEVIDLCSD